jgi:hypothetical protein
VAIEFAASLKFNVAGGVRVAIGTGVFVLSGERVVGDKNGVSVRIGTMVGLLGAQPESNITINMK